MRVKYMIGHPTPTVKVAHPHKKGAFMLINESDFDSETMEAYEERAEAPKPGRTEAPTAKK